MVFLLKFSLKRVVVGLRHEKENQRNSEKENKKVKVQLQIKNLKKIISLRDPN